MSKWVHRIYISVFVLIEVIVLILLLKKGYEYYQIPLNERPFSDLHKTLKPGGFLGHGYGIIGTIMMIIGVFGYILRKRLKFMYRWGRLKYWLEFHIFLCTLGPMLVLFHTAFKFGGLISISFWSMVAVVLSGVIGRFIYIQIPKTMDGKELSLDDIKQLQEEAKAKINNKYGLDKDTLEKISSILESKKEIPGLLSTILNFNFKNRRNLNKIKHLLKNIEKDKYKDIISLVKTELSLSTKVFHLNLMKKLFGYWHVIHLPFALIMLVIAIVHVGIAIAFGYTWEF